MNTQLAKVITIFLTCLLWTLGLTGQSQNIKRSLPIKVITKQTETKTLLRWAFESPTEWYPNRNISFDIYRADLADGKNKKYIPIAKDVSVSSREKLEAKFAQDESNIGIGAILQANYGEWESQGKEKKGFGILDKKDELENKYLILLYTCDIDWKTAELAGLGFEDTSTDLAKDYIYRFVPSDTTFLIKHIIAEKDMSPVLKITDRTENENQIIIGWNRHKYEDAYTGFFIEKSKNGAIYKRINQVPYVHLESDDFNEMKLILWQDSVINYEPQYYRIVGIDAFGEESLASDPVRLQGRDRTAPATPKGKVALDPDQLNVRISWTPSLDDDIDGYVIRKTYKGDGLYKELDRVDKSVLLVEDPEVELVDQTYYQICAVDTANNYACTTPLYLVLDDKIAPSPPQNLSGNIDTNGVVTLTWDLGKETDLMGYYVQVSNGTQRVFTSCTDKHLSTNIWQDTIPLNVLTEDIYYRVNAVDLRSNTSEFSEIIRLEKPDIVPPNASLFSDYEVTDSSIVISLIKSSSKDVEKIELQRKSSNSPFITAGVIQRNQSQFIDKEIKSNTQYTYRLITIDDAGNSTMSPSQLSVTTQNINSNYPIELAYVTDGDNAELTWNINGNAPQYVKLYKGPSIKMKSIKTFKADEMKYSITPVTGEEYRIRVFYSDGSKSAYSNPVKL